VRYRELISNALRIGRSKGIDPLELELLLCWSFSITRSQYWADRDAFITNPVGKLRFKHGLRRMLRAEPLDHILKEKEFYSRRFFVNRHVLVPRPETEILVETALQRISDCGPVLEIGSGSGCVAITLALEAGIEVTALEIDRRALKVLKRNIRRFKVRELVYACRGNLFPRWGGEWQMIVANPPYLSCGEWRALPPRIRMHEPRGALVAGEAGTEILHRIVTASPAHIRKGGWLVLETGHDQAGGIAESMRAAGFRGIVVTSDLSGIERVVSGQL